MGDISDEVWKLRSKFTYLNLGGNKLKVISPLVCDLVHLQHLQLNRNKISEEGDVELLKVRCSVVLLVDCGGLMVVIIVDCCCRGVKLSG